MYDVVNNVGRICVRGCVTRFEAATLVDRNIDHDRTRTHLLDVIRGYQLRCSSTGYQYRTDNQISICCEFVNRVTCRVNGVHTTTPDVIQLAQARQ